MDLDCPHRPPCPGCPVLGRTGYPAEARARVERLSHDAGLDVPPLIAGPATGFRCRARLAVRGRAKSPKIGLFEAASHRVVHVPRCLIHAPIINEAAAALTRAIKKTGTAPYSDEADRGLLRYCQIVASRRTGTVQVALVGNTENLDELTPVGNELSTELGDSLHSLFFNGNPGRRNTILGPAWRHVSGPPAVAESIADTDVFFVPAAFGQSNLSLFERLVAAVRERVPAGKCVVELYAGTGAIGLGLLERSSEVVFNEVAPAGLDGLRLGLKAQPTPLSGRARVVPGPAAAATPAIAEADVVIADPPRRGLDPEVIQALCARPPATLLYVACGVDAFERDVRALAGSGLRLVELLAFDLFPHTPHVELVGRFARA